MNIVRLSGKWFHEQDGSPDHAHVSIGSMTASTMGTCWDAFFRDPGGRPMVKTFMIDKFIVELNQEQYNDKVWKDKSIKIALVYEYEKEQVRKDFDERFIWAQRPPRSRF